MACHAAASMPAQAAESARAIASRTGEVIGAASVCGVQDDELMAVGAKVIGRARDAARSSAEVRAAQRAHEAAVMRGAARVEKAGPEGCEDAVTAFRMLEQESR